MASDIVVRVKRFLEMRPDVAAHQIGAHTRFAQSTIRHVLDGQREASAEVSAELERVLNLAIAGEIFGGGEPVVITEERGDAATRVRRQRDFYVTETVQKIGKFLSYCAEMAAIGVATAEYGVGKTEAMKAWRKGAGRKVESLPYEFDSFSSASRIDFINAIAELLEVDHRTGHQYGGTTLRAVCRALNDRPCLLILDQCEEVKAPVFQVVRQIWDRTRESGVGIAMLGAPVLMERMMASRVRDLGAISSRVGVWAQLQGLSKEEMADILKREGVVELADEVFDAWHRAVGGSMRRLMASVDMVRAKHIAAGKPVTRKTLAGVAQNLWGLSVEAVN